MRWQRTHGIASAPELLVPVRSSGEGPLYRFWVLREECSLFQIMAYGE